MLLILVLCFLPFALLLLALPSLWLKKKEQTLNQISGQKEHREETRESDKILLGRFCSILLLLLLSSLLCIHIFFFIFASMSCCPLVVVEVTVVVEKGDAFVEFFGLMIERMELLCVFGLIWGFFFAAVGKELSVTFRDYFSRFCG